MSNSKDFKRAANGATEMQAKPSLSSRANARLLIIRFSSFGDIVQACGVPAAFREQFKGADVDWLVRSDFAGLLNSHPEISRVISYERKSGLLALLRLAWRLSGNGYSHIYDAHNNLRSNLVNVVFKLRGVMNLFSAKPTPRFVQRSKERLKRWLFFRLRLKVLPQPYRGALSFHAPLTKWGLKSEIPRGPQFFTAASLPEEIKLEIQQLPRPRIALAPSAAWEMKRWPIEHWQELIRITPNASFFLLGGPEDQFIQDIQMAAPERCRNLAGRLSLAQSAALLKEVDLVIANDTGILHVADQMEVPTFALIGPTAFGYPSHETSQTIEIDLPCKPCSKDGRGGCKNDLYQRCMKDLKPALVHERVQKMKFSSSEPET